MNRKIVYCILMLFLLSLPFLLDIFNTNFRNVQNQIVNNPADLNNSAVNVNHPPDIILNYGDPTVQTISWTLNESGARNYLGTYSFTNDTDGSVPSGWTRPSHAVNTDGKIVSEKSGHRKVIEMYDNNPNTSGNGYTILATTFPGQVAGTVEWWYYGISAGPVSELQFLIYGAASNAVYLVYNMSSAALLYYDSSWHTICALSNDVWHHLRVNFNCTADTFDIWVDGTLRKTNALFTNPQTSLTKLDLYTGGATTGGFYVYFDAFDFSWTPGYYLNRNMAHESPQADYLGLYSFTDDTDGSMPSGWTRPSHAVNTDGKIVSEKSGHRKVIEMYDNNPDTSGNGYTILANTFPGQVAGTVEWWYYGISAGPASELQFPIYGAASNAVALIYNMSSATLVYYDGSLRIICALSNDVWHHLRVNFNCTSDTFDIWVDGTLRKANALFTNPQTSLTNLDLYTGGPSTGGFYVYFDAFDYSWAPGYYLNRNMNYVPSISNLTYAIFEDGIPKTSWQTWSGNTIVNYNISGIDLNVGMHNVSLVFQDDIGAWGHDDVQVTVSDNEAPKILGVVQDPITPSYSEVVNITAHIADSNQVQTVLIESNNTGGETGNYLGTYSFTNDADGSVPSGWTRTYHYSSTDGKIVAGQAGHNKVLETYDNNSGGYTILEQSFGNKSAGAVELWYYGIAGFSPACNLQFLIRSQFDLSGVYLILNFSYAQIGYWDTRYHKICDSANDQWHHLRIIFNCGSDTYDIWVDGIQRKTNAAFQFPQNNLAKVVIYTGGGSTGGYYCYFDAFDYSWAPGYYLNRNLLGSFGFVNNSMTLLSGSQNDGVWSYTINNYPANNTILYRILAKDTSGKWNATEYFSFGYFDTSGPNIFSVIQEPLAPTYLDIVNVTVRVTDTTQVQTVSIQSNHTGTFLTYPMSLISGNLKDGIWKFIFNLYPLNAVIIYSILTKDILGNSNSSDQTGFGVFDLIDPTILYIVQIPAVLTKWEAVKVTAHVQENIALGSVTLNSNYTGNWANYPMTLLNGTLQDGFWEYTISSYPYNSSIWYRVSAIDITGRTATTSYSQFGIFPIVSYYVPLDLDFEVDVGMAGDRRTDITFTFQNTGNTHLMNMNFSIELPAGWTAMALGPSVNQLGPGESATITFKVTVPKDIGEFLALVVINVDARITELGLNWPTQSIEVVVSGVKVWDSFIWFVIIVGSASAAVTTTYVYIHGRSVRSKVSTIKMKGKNTAAISEALRSDIPGILSTISLEVMEKIENLRGITPDEKILLIQYVSRLEEEDALIYLDQIKTTEMN